jgi:ubiquinone/menaquinone biosynthesis C-methylase UbiE
MCLRIALLTAFRSIAILIRRDKEAMPSKSEDDIKRFNRWAATYDQSVMQRWYFGPIHSAMLDLLEQEKLTEPPHSILDVGCGTGRLLRAASIRWPQTKLFGVDPAEQMISEAKRLNPNTTFKVGEAESLAFPHQSIVLVLISLSFHHWADQSKGLQEIARVLRPGGWLCLADHTILLANLFQERVKSLNQIRTLISDVGLSVQSHRRLWTRFILITLARK